MKTPFLLTGLVVLLIQGGLFGQHIGFDEIDSSRVSPWVVKWEIQYQHVYHFGASEMESDLLLFFWGNQVFAQIKSGEWNDEGKAWVWQYNNLTNVRISGNKFYSDQTNGEFVTYNDGQNLLKGLKVYQPWSGIIEEGETEIGLRSYSIQDYFSGNYPQASMRLLGREELASLSKQELKRMRNEIFARYGYRFIPGGEMDTYFNQQDWYAGQHANVDTFLTEVEKENVQLIRKIERE